MKNIGLNFTKLGGIVPTIVQNYKTRQVLMLGFMNKEAMRKTINEKVVWFYSRTKKRLWMKGESSGCVLSVKKIISDCDNDSLLILVSIKKSKENKVCHKDNKTCFIKGEQDI